MKVSATYEVLWTTGWIVSDILFDEGGVPVGHKAPCETEFFHGFRVLLSEQVQDIFAVNLPPIEEVEWIVR